ncbi:MAG: hypothetical protein JKY94_08470 [Rhodobacteraceae bacterium]|nr:hypothetical protein [Paracoccaceae bacterium]
MNAKSNTAEQVIFDEIEAEIAELEEDFGSLGLDDDDGEVSSSELDELDAALAGTEFVAEAAESSDMDEISILQIADGIMPGSGGEEGIFSGLGGFVKKTVGWVSRRVKNQAKSLINKLLKLVRRASKYRSCAPKVALAVGAYKVGKYGTALKLGWSAYRCIRSKS